MMAEQRPPPEAARLTRHLRALKARPPAPSETMAPACNGLGLHALGATPTLCCWRRPPQPSRRQVVLRYRPVPGCEVSCDARKLLDRPAQCADVDHLPFLINARVDGLARMAQDAFANGVNYVCADHPRVAGAAERFEAFHLRLGVRQDLLQDRRPLLGEQIRQRTRAARGQVRKQRFAGSAAKARDVLEKPEPNDFSVKRNRSVKFLVLETSSLCWEGRQEMPLRC